MFTLTPARKKSGKIFLSFRFHAKNHQGIIHQLRRNSLDLSLRADSCSKSIKVPLPLNQLLNSVLRVEIRFEIFKAKALSFDT